MVPDLASYDVILVNSSAGKDSQAMLDYVVGLADAAGVRGRVVVLHCDLGLSPKGNPIEWAGTKELAAEHAAHYGLRFILAKRGICGFLEKIEGIGFWPRASTRYCTSYFKRDSAATAVTALADEQRDRQPRTPRILQCFGFRAEESPKRRKMPQFATDKRISNGRKRVDVWLPIQDWTEAMVWQRIRQAGTRHHPAYDLGMPRLSCVFCIFAPKAALMRAAKANPALFAEYLGVEERIGHKFRVNLALADVKAALDRGEEPGPVDGAWNM